MVADPKLKLPKREVITYLMRLVTGGDRTLTEITFELAKSSFPEAFYLS